MKSISFIFFLLVSISVCSQSANEIIQRSLQFYAVIPAAKFSFDTKFKSAIAADTSFYFYEGRFCKKENIKIYWKSGATEYVDNGAEALVFTSSNNTLDFISRKDKNTYPQRIMSEVVIFNPDQFLYKVGLKKYDVRINEGYFILSRTESPWKRDVQSEEYWFDTLTSELRKHIDIIDSKKYGVQYKETAISLFKLSLSACENENYDTKKVYAIYKSKKDSFLGKAKMNLFTEGDVGKQFSDFSVAGISGKTYSSKQLAGSYVLIDMFYQSCLPCVRSIADINKLHEKFKNKGLIVLGVDHLPMDTVNMDAFIKRYDVKYDVVVGKDGFNFWSLILNTSFPTHILLDPEGRIALFSTGTSKKFYKGVDKLLSKFQHSSTN